MKLSATINFFDGEELLLQCVRNIRPLAEHLSIVWQSTSNYGNPMSELARAKLHQLEAERIVDDLIHFEPNLLAGGSGNEIEKRRIGIACARERGCSHFLLMDADEFYIPDEFMNAREVIERREIDFSTVSHFIYAKEPIYRTVAPVPLNVSFITRMSDDLVHELRNDIHPAGMIDPTRAPLLPGGRYFHLPPDSVAMHHMTGIRLDPSSKLANSSVNDDQGNVAVLKEQIRAVELWRPEETMTLFGIPFMEVADQFGLSTWREDAARQPG